MVWYAPYGWAQSRRISKPTLDRIERHDREYEQHSKHNHWNADEIQCGGPERAAKEAGTVERVCHRDVVQKKTPAGLLVD